MHNQLKHFNEAIHIIIHNHIPNKSVTCNETHPHWLNEHIRYLIKRKQKYLRSTSKKEDQILIMKS